MDKTIEYDDIVETFQHIVDEVIYVWNEIEEIIKKTDPFDTNPEIK